MFFTEDKLKKRLEQLEPLRYRDAFEVPEYIAIEDIIGENGMRPPTATLENQSTWLRTGDLWKGRDRYLWLSASVDIPAEWSDRTVVGLFDFGITEGGNNGGFESLAYWNHQPYQGVDSNHMEMILPVGYSGEARLDFRLWSGLEGGGPPREMNHQIKRSQIAWLDRQVDTFFYTSKAILQTITILAETVYERSALLQCLDKAFHQINWSKPGSDSFYESVYIAADQLDQQLTAMKQHHPVTVTALGHTHIDVAWLWRLKHTREKAARSFSTVLRLMEHDPDYIFLQTQPQLYDYIKQDYPDIYEKIKARISEGRWEAGGGMWVEADCNLTSGESLVRQFLFGTRFFEQEFGVSSTYLWLPDVFGYSWALPQILKKSGFDTFMTTKISWNQVNRMPHDTFQWRGIDGSEVLTHFITTPDDWEGGNSFFYTYNGLIEAPTVQGIWNSYQDKEVNQNLLLSYGYGDGGGGVTREMLELRRQLDRIPGVPQVTTGRADDYFEQLNTTFDHTDRYVHTWDGELYLEYHRGTYTSQAYNKKMNRKLELLYRETEWLQTIQSVLATDWSTYAQQSINEGWKIILRNQFHDIIPGSSIAEVYEDSTKEYAEALQIGQHAWSSASTALTTTDDHSVTVFNSSSWAVSPTVHIPFTLCGTEDYQWIDAQQYPLQAQRADDHWIVQTSTIPALGVSTIYYNTIVNTDDNTIADSVPFLYEEGRLVTPYYELQWNEQGQLISIMDVENVRQVLAPDARGNVFQLFEDKPMNFDSWDIDIFYQEKMEEINHLISVRLVSTGLLQTTVEFVWQYDETVITQQLTVYARSRRIDFQTHVDWKERQKLLKVAFPVQIRSTEATYDIQFGNVKRPTHWNTSWDWARFESVGHQWADLSERNYGVSLLNDCKYGYDIKDNVMRLSLLKSAIYPDPQADYGQHEFTYSLYPHAGDWLTGHTVQEASALNQPCQIASGKAHILNTDRSSFSMFTLSAAHVMIDAIKKAEDHDLIVLRVHEYGGIRSPLQITSDLVIESWQECNLMEQPIGDVQHAPLSIEISPYEIRTFLISLQGV